MANLRDRMVLAKCTVTHTLKVHQEATKFPGGKKRQSRMAV